MVIDSRIVVTVNIADNVNSKCYTLMMIIVIVRIPIMANNKNPYHAE